MEKRFSKFYCDSCGEEIIDESLFDENGRFKSCIYAGYSIDKDGNFMLEEDYEKKDDNDPFDPVIHIGISNFTGFSHACKKCSKTLLLGAIDALKHHLSLLNSEEEGA